MSVDSMTFGFDEDCNRQHEFLRRFTSKTPDADGGSAYWAGDLLVVPNYKIKQFEQNDLRSVGDNNLTWTYPAQNSSCGQYIVHPYGNCEIETTEITEQANSSGTDSGSFKWAVPKEVDGKKLWDEDILASSDAGCGVLTDGGDCYSNASYLGRIDSVCGTISREMYNPVAYFFDNRSSTSDDKDTGLLYIIGGGVVRQWELRWIDQFTQINKGLDDAEDITSLFLDAVAERGLDIAEIVEFGMI